MKYILFLSFLAVSCGVPYESSNKVFIEYTTRFTEHSKIPVMIPITFSDLNEAYVGVCISYSGGRKEIKIDANFWNEASDSTKEQIIFHELGHCVLNRGHDNTQTTPKNHSRSIPNSIMYSYVFGHYRFYKEFHDHYVQELFNPGKQL